jgi:hypothetical protein
VFVSFLCQDRAPVSTVAYSAQAGPVEKRILNIPEQSVAVFLELEGGVNFK